MSRAFTFALVLAVAPLGPTTALAQTPPAIEEWPYRFVVSGPSNAQSGDEVTYRIDYELLDAGAPASPGFVFGWQNEAASFLASRVVAGPQGVINEMGPHSMAWDFSERPPSGAVEFVLHIAPAFTGDLGVGIYVRGTHIILPEGSVDSLTTKVTGPAEFPSTGTGRPAHAGSPVTATLLLALSGAIALAAGAALRFSHRT